VPRGIYGRAAGRPTCRAAPRWDGRGGGEAVMLPRAPAELLGVGGEVEVARGLRLPAIHLGSQILGGGRVRGPPATHPPGEGPGDPSTPLEILFDPMGCAKSTRPPRYGTHLSAQGRAPEGICEGDIGRRWVSQGAAEKDPANRGGAGRSSVGSESGFTGSQIHTRTHK